MKLLYKTSAKSTLVLFLTLTILTLGFSGCAKKAERVSVQTYKISDLNEYKQSVPDKRLHICGNSPASLEYLTKSGLLEMYFDKVSYSISIRETLTKDYWHTLPCISSEGTGSYDYSAAPAVITVVHGADTYYLNTQDNSVAYGNVKTSIPESSGSGLLVSYIITPDRETAEKTDYSASDIAFLLKIEYMLQDGSLFVSCNYENLSGNNDAVIKEISLLNHFGSVQFAEKGDFFLLPDESGAVLDISNSGLKFEETSFAVYGNDFAINDTGDYKNALIPAFGIKKGSGGFAALILSGAERARIVATPGTNGEFSTLNAVFNTTAVLDVEKNDKVKRYVENLSGTGELKLCLRFVSGGNATYAGMAAVCREQLTREGILSSKTVETDGDLPLNLSVIGAADRNLTKRIPLRLPSNLTTFEQAEDLITRLKAKGVNNINLRYKGALEGGINQTDLKIAGIKWSLGGKKGLNSLAENMKTQKMNLFLDINILSDRTPRIGLIKKYASTITGERVCVENTPELTSCTGYAGYSRALLPLKGLESSILRTLTKYKEISSMGFCINDGAGILYGDFSIDGFDRKKAVSELSGRLASLATEKKMMVDTGNFYALKNANIIVNLPMPLNTDEAGDLDYRYVPFLQLILHGTVDYSGKPINYTLDCTNGPVDSAEIMFRSAEGKNQKDLQDMLLKYLEYGACPAYELTYENPNEGEGGIGKFYYDDWAKQIVDYYKKAHSALSDLRDVRMIKHSCVQPGVFCSEYEGGRMIYVNYTEQDVDLGGITVAAGGFISL